MQKIEKLEELASSSRRSGNSTWLLKSALKNPKVVIIYGNADIAKDAERMFNMMYEQQNWFIRTLHKLAHRPRPMFISSKTATLDGLRRPVVFDNSAIIC